jgi:hypothetical protein
MTSSRTLVAKQSGLVSIKSKPTYAKSHVHTCNEAKNLNRQACFRALIFWPEDIENVTNGSK